MTANFLAAADSARFAPTPSPLVALVATPSHFSTSSLLTIRRKSAILNQPDLLFGVHGRQRLENGKATVECAVESREFALPYTSRIAGVQSNPETKS